MTPRSILLVASFALATSSAHAVYKVGDTVANFILKDVDNPDLVETRGLYDFRGKVIVLNFGEYWCGPCNSEWSRMDAEFWQPNKDEDVMILTIGSDQEPLFQDKQDQYGGGWPWLFDTTGDVFRDFGVSAIPYNVVLDQNFTVQWTSTGWSGNFDMLQIFVDYYKDDIFVQRIEPQHYVVSPGGSVSLDLTLVNAGTTDRSVQAFIDVVMPDHTEFPGNPFASRPLTLPANSTINARVTMDVPPVAPPGEYSVRVGMGEDVNAPRCSDTVVVEVQ